eukprot:TRINITY_DN1358_c0_g1_i10.p2 TRINITY_DN1358_c0_g1~~TRINITY_DN1358_c0_g1_i10.p2  ORF type:complete len:248 (-),score=28.75 TRINITY_DN1358_c0_g1_i10:504-1247(-)
MSGLVGTGFLQGFLKSWGVVLVSEIGDKTFFIAAIMAIKNSRSIVFSGCISALAAMTVLSALLGWAAPALIPKVYTHWAATALFFFFGLKMLYDVYQGETEDSAAEMAQVEQELDNSWKNGSNNGVNGKISQKNSAMKVLQTFLSPILLKAFSLTFLAEWGDRSQIATIGLATQDNVWGVSIGGIIGHVICTGAAVIGGRHLASHVDERKMSIIGGLLFIAFGLHAVYEGLYVLNPLQEETLHQDLY